MFRIDRFRRSGVFLAIMALLCSGLTVAVFSADAEAQGTVITVDSTLDPDGSENRDTCGLTIGSGALTRAAPDGLCTLRRAIIEAERLPDSARPIQIVFDISTNDPNYDASLGIWEVQIDESDPWAIASENLKQGGGVIIDGDTQPGGRSIGPKIMINTNRDDLGVGGAALVISTPNNVITNVGFHGGGGLQIQRANNLVENIWMGLNNAGTEMQTESTSLPANLAGGGIDLSNSASDNNIIRNNVIIGTKSRSISVTSGGSGNLITGNSIGTDANGAVDGALNCVANTTFFASIWYGGSGIRVTGSNNVITNNRLAGLNTTRATNETRPIALEIFGTANVVTGNIVGIDSEGDHVGVCGRGLQFGGSQSTATGNTFVNTKASVTDDIGTLFDSAIFSQSFSGGGNGANDFLEVHSNIIDGGDDPDSNFYVYRFGDVNIPEVLRKFNPAKVTEVSGTTVSGTNGDEDAQQGIEGFCPGCKIYLYADDDDDRIEALELLGTATADANGDWSTTISRALGAGEGIRTQSQALSANVIGNHGANITTHLSDDLFPLAVEAFCLEQLVTINMNLGASGTGTASRDVILGTPGPDVISGLGGNDIICGEGGNDVITGDAGGDVIDGGSGDDTINGGDGDDALGGGDGLDFVFGEDGDDFMLGGEGNDRLRGGPGVDEIHGENGNDFLYGGIEGDEIFGGSGNDTIGGFGGADTIVAGEGNDKVFGGFGADIILGGPGNDDLRGLIGNDIISGEEGDDKLNGDNGQDELFGDAGSDVLNGGNGPDVLQGGSGNDVLSGGKADDTLIGGSGTSDRCTGNLGTDTADATCEDQFGIP